jgi:hypothetical protein
MNVVERAAPKKAENRLHAQTSVLARRLGVQL